MAKYIPTYTTTSFSFHLSKPIAIVVENLEDVAAFNDFNSDPAVETTETTDAFENEDDKAVIEDDTTSFENEDDKAVIEDDTTSFENEDDKAVIEDDTTSFEVEDNVTVIKDDIVEADEDFFNFDAFPDLPEETAPVSYPEHDVLGLPSLSPTME